MDGIPFAQIGLGTGWAAFFGVVFIGIRAFVKGDLVSGAIYQVAISAADKIGSQFERLQTTHAETTRQNTELLEAARFTRAVAEAVDRKTQTKQDIP